MAEFEVPEGLLQMSREEREREWCGLVMEIARRNLLLHGSLPLIVFTYAEHEDDPLGFIEKSRAGTVDCFEIDSEDEIATRESLAALREVIFAEGYTAALMIGEGWDYKFSGDELAKVSRSEDAIPDAITECVFVKLETPRGFYLSKTPIDRSSGRPDFSVAELLEFDFIPAEQMPRNVVRLLACNDL